MHPEKFLLVGWGGGLWWPTGLLLFNWSELKTWIEESLHIHKPFKHMPGSRDPGVTIANPTEISAMYGYVTWRRKTEISVMYGSEGVKTVLLGKSILYCPNFLNTPMYCLFSLCFSPSKTLFSPPVIKKLLFIYCCYDPPTLSKYFKLN